MTELEIYKNAFNKLQDWRNGCMKSGLHTNGILTHPDGTKEPHTRIVPHDKAKYYDLVISETLLELELSAK